MGLERKRDGWTGWCSKNEVLCSTETDYLHRFSELEYSRCKSDKGRGEQKTDSRSALVPEVIVRLGGARLVGCCVPRYRSCYHVARPGDGASNSRRLRRGSAGFCWWG